MSIIWSIVDWFRELAMLLAIVLAGLVLLAGLVVGYFPLTKYLPVVGNYVKVAKLAAFLAFGLLCALLTFQFMDDQCTARIEADRVAAKAAAQERDKNISDDLGRKYGPEILRLKSLNETLQQRVKQHAKLKPVAAGGGSTCRLGDAAGWMPSRSARPAGAATGGIANHLRADPRAR